MPDQGNAVVRQIIDTQATTQQYKTLSQQIVDLDASFVQLTKDVIAFSNAASNAKGFADFNKQAIAAQAAQEKLIQTQNQALIATAKLNEADAKAAIQEQKLADAKNKSLIVENQLSASKQRAQAAQEKATAATQKALSPYQQLSKELDRQRLAAKDLGITYGQTSPQFLKAQAGVLKLDNQLKTLDKSLGQNQRNVGNYEHDVASALNSLYAGIDRAIPGAGQLTRTVVEGFQRITNEARKSRNEITNLVNTPGGFGFKPQESGPVQIDNSTATIANTEATAANTEANAANAESETAKAAATGEATAATVKNTATTGESTGVLSLLGEGFATFSTLGFVAAIGAATYYLSQFKSTGNDIDKFLGALKNQFSNFGENLVDLFKNLSLKNLIPAYDLGQLFKGSKSAFDTGIDLTQAKIDLKNADETSQVFQAQTQAEADKFRALSKDRKVDIADRQHYLKQAQADEELVLQSQKDNADLTIETAIQIGNKTKKLTADQIKYLKTGDLNLAQDLALDGQKFTEEGYELYKQGVEKKIAYQAGATNQLVKLQADADNMQLRADNGLAKAQDRLDKARVQSALDASKLILDDSDASGKEKLAANEKFVEASIRLIKIQRQNELDNAGLGSTRGGKDSRTEAKTRLAIEVETQNAINKVKAEGLKQDDTIQKQINADVTKDYEARQKIAVTKEKELLAVYKEAENERLLQLDSNYSKISAVLAKQYKDGIISAEEYNARISQLQKENAEDKLKTQIDAAKKTVSTQAVGVVYGTTDPKELQASANDLVKLQNQASDLATKNEIDNIHKIEAAKKELSNLEKEIAEESIDLIKSVVDQGYQNEIEALRKKSEALDLTATAEKNNIQNALLSEKQKAAQTRILDAQTASEKAALLAAENRIKTKQAEFDKAISVAQIIENIGSAEVGALKYLADPVTAVFYPEIAALIGVLGALQLTKVIATPIPKYKQGTPGHAGGLGIVGDGYLPELVQYPNGYTFLSPPKPTLLDMPEGTTVVPGLETVKQLAKINYSGGQSISFKEVAELLKINNKYQKKIAEKPSANTRGLVEAMIAAQAYETRKSQYFK
jgi:hypothetical protein